MWFFISLMSFILAIISHAVLSRLMPYANRVILFMVVGIAVGSSLIYLNHTLYNLFSIETAASALLYAFLCELYLFLFTFALASISANLLQHMSIKSLSANEIEAIYDSRKMVLNRYNRLISNGLIIMDSAGIEGEGFIISPKGLKLLNSLIFLRTIFKHD
jgi:hypothetical protein